MILAPSTHTSLLLRLRDSQDQQAWFEFATLYEPAIYRLLRRRGLQDSDACEIMQEIFLAVSRSIDRWNSAWEQGSFRGWLQTVARNLTVSWLRQRERRTPATGGSDMLRLLDMLPDQDGPASAEFDFEVRRALFHRAADLVRGEVQEATWAAFWETSLAGTPIADVAENLGMSPGAIRVARCRVLARLRALVNEMDQTT